MSLSRISRQLHAKSTATLLSLETNLDRILLFWLGLAGAACALRLVASPLSFESLGFNGMLPYALLVLAPAASIALALRWFADGERQPQPVTRLAVIGSWRTLGPAEARRHPLYGTNGIMVSLLIGMLLNIPMRGVEYLAAIPPVAAGAPQWVQSLQFAMTLDVVLFSSLYGIAFVAALRRVPLFPRLLLTIWLFDITMQVVIAHLTVPTGLPGGVAEALQSLLFGNVKKVLISMALWLPYLLLSTRVNVTYRHRVPA